MQLSPVVSSRSRSHPDVQLVSPSVVGRRCFMDPRELPFSDSGHQDLVMSVLAFNDRLSSFSPHLRLFVVCIFSSLLFPPHDPTIETESSVPRGEPLSSSLVSMPSPHPLFPVERWHSVYASRVAAMAPRVPAGLSDQIHLCPSARGWGFCWLCLSKSVVFTPEFADLVLCGQVHQHSSLFLLPDKILAHFSRFVHLLTACPPLLPPATQSPCGMVLLFCHHAPQPGC